MAFSATDAAFEGFRLARRQPLTAIGLSTVQLLVGVLVPILMINGGFQELVAAGAAGASADPKESLALMSKLIALEAQFIPIIMIMSVVAAGAVYRGVLRPTDHGWILGLKIGADEFRLFLVSLVKALLFFAVALGCAVVLVILAAIGGVVSGKGNGGAMVAIMMVVGLGYVAMLGLMVYLAVRLSLAGPATVADKRFRLLSTWSMTKGRFWPLFGCYLLAFVLYLLAGIIAYAVTAILVFAASGFHMDVVVSQLFKPDLSSMSGYFTPMRILILAISAVVAGVLQMIIMAPVAEAWRQLTGAGSAETFA